ncbi:bifunctional lysylphosphatidylglycerol synthetase/lysine--tRNA ligase LysX [Frankia sp. CNm7]|uniref:Lysine--tRNA ligase n=2 Tax=Frankia nepalensis TaxID=1836974 RepID=A0A937R6A2_9ACTN|nr:bifunctional lysylphosphatidylglycerol synthetase/lysine--tRNA ligase LysX [Frankia nepalensis]MBL7510184.1 bifunctional lysylphosphatidylglycerol synthetase/lysine--tRNA ligase LysX [Frankia nepalensis]MBL7518558.1 bifunctional lysylphosphatidylglycerol synthetase/lysine--tRNA ligase LysX [Frankia nepalensis]MBL7626031.1 bifunctional lysylphosphatidylglycerol synthetase/lysine--tRNA ligase LysX [Frankia nepalensis]
MDGRGDAVVSVVGRILLVAACWSLVSLALRRVHWARRVDDVFGLVNLPVSPSLFSTALLFVLAGAVRRRMRGALWLLLAFQAVAAGYLIALLVRFVTGARDVRDLSTLGAAYLVANAAVTVAVMALLWLSRPAFSSRLEPGARWRALGVLVGGLAASVALSVALTLLFPAQLTGVGRRVVWGARAALGVEPNSSEVGWQGQHGYHWIAVLAGLLSAVSLIAAAVVFLRSARAKAYLTAADELVVRGLLLRAGQRDSLGYFATRHDKSVVFSPRRDAAVTYRVLAAVSLASADPIGPRAAWAGAIEAWLAEARLFGWFPAVLAASEEGARAYVAAGLKALPIGDEAVIDVAEFSLRDARMEPVRRAARRVRRAGYTITVTRHGALSAGELAEIGRRAEDWRRDDTERGFSMALGRLGDPADEACVAVLAHDGDGQLRGVLSMVPWGSRGLSLDLMRRERNAENGLVEAMVAALVDAARDELGVRVISLNFAIFREVFSAAERIGAGPGARLNARVLTSASRFWQIESLYRSNARYLPRWTPRYLCYDSTLTLTRVAFAAGMAEGYLPTFARPREPARDTAVEYDGRELPFAEAVAAQRRAAFRLDLPRQRPAEQQRVRHAKLDRLRAAGMDPYPAAVARDSEIADLRSRFGDLAPDTRTDRRVSVTGRVHALRDHGGLIFAVLREGDASIQVMVDRSRLDPALHRLFRAAVDLGDHLSVTGEVTTSRRGELSVSATGWQMAAKCLRPLPSARAGFTDPDARARQRHLDMIVNADTRRMLVGRSRAVGEIRRFFVSRRFTEVETPMLQAVHGGANARPFITHINAYDSTLYLRIAPELYLKRLCVGGMPRIFELNRNFRNEGADATHNPEFTSVEAYQAYSDYLEMRDLTRELVIAVATAVHGAPIARRPGPDGRLADVDLSGPWRSVTVHDAVSAAVGRAVTADTPREELAGLCRERGITPPLDAAAGTLVAALYDELVEPATTDPTFYLDFPAATSPLTRAHRRDARLAERWDLVAFGVEIGTAYSELVDPVDQRTRLTEQSLLAAAGDPEAMQVDEAFLSALEYAMPPTGGLGIGVDRLVMMLTGASIRQTLAFPFVRPAPLPAAAPGR